MIAQDLISYHCPKYKQVWVNSNKILGRCNYKDKRIELSLDFASLNVEDRIINTILHEIAHALTGFELDSHGPKWQAKAIELGAIPKPICNLSARPKFKYYYECPICKRRWYRDRQWLQGRQCKKDKTKLVQHYNW